MSRMGEKPSSVSDAERRLWEVFDEYPDDDPVQYRAARALFAVKPGSMNEIVFRLWFNEQRRHYRKRREH